ncbi:hypothetical protein L9F63_025352, partial [Diploptera punctata]
DAKLTWHLHFKILEEKLGQNDIMIAGTGQMLVERRDPRMRIGTQSLSILADACPSRLPTRCPSKVGTRRRGWGPNTINFGDCPNAGT